MKRISIAAFLITSLVTSAFAAAPPKPLKCPDISHIKGVHFTQAKAVFDSNLWMVSQPANRYGTHEAWHFTVDVEADDKNGAMKEALAAIASMKLIEGPEVVGEEWLCHYRSGQHDATASFALPLKKKAETTA